MIDLGVSRAIFILRERGESWAKVSYISFTFRVVFGCESSMREMNINGAIIVIIRHKLFLLVVITLVALREG